MKQYQAFNRVCSMVRAGMQSVASKLGLAGLPSQIHLMLLVNLLFSIGRNLAFPYLAMYLTGFRTTGGLEMDPSLVGFMFMGGAASHKFWRCL